MFRDAVDKKGEIIEFPVRASVGDLLNPLVDRYGDDFGLYIYDKEKWVRDYLSFMLNGVNVYSVEGLDTMLRDGDVLSILPPIGGG